jgi:hypothetical protein
MRSVGFVAACALASAGCQWVLPIHEEEAIADSGAYDDASLTEAAPGQAVHPVADAGGGDAPPTVSCDHKYTYVPACDDCLNQKCCVESNACFISNPECVALFKCLMGCGFDFITCPLNCQAAHDAGIDDFDRANACAAGYCGKPCSKDGG